MLLRCGNGVVSVLLRWFFDGSSMVLRWFFDGCSKELGPFCPSAPPSGASKRRPPTQPWPGFGSMGLAAIQKESHFRAV